MHSVVVEKVLQRAEYQQASDRNRAALQAQLLQQGFGQAQTFSSTSNLQTNMNLASAQLGLGQLQQAYLGQQVAASNNS